MVGLEIIPWRPCEKAWYHQAFWRLLALLEGRHFRLTGVLGWAAVEPGAWNVDPAMGEAQAGLLLLDAHDRQMSDANRLGRF
jgi:hypothetical protein